MRRFTLYLPAVLLVALCLIAGSFAAPVMAAPPAQDASCRFFTETGGGQGGFSVCDDGDARFLTAFQGWGLQKIGYPISRRYVRDGFVTQAFQKAIMQWRPESQSVALVNIFDDLHNAGFDEKLLEVRQTPNQLPDGWDGDLPFAEVVTRRQALLDARPALRDTYFESSDPLTFYGLPTSEVTDMGNHYAVRLQRAVLQEWKEDVPWAKAGEVTIANGGDIAKELGSLPAEAIVPEPEGATPATPPAPEPSPAPQAPAASGKIVMTSNRESYDDCYIANADGSGLQRLTTFGLCYDAHFAPDGRIVFSHQETPDGQYDIWIMNEDGSGQTNLTDTPNHDEAFPVVSPDGQKIAYLFTWEGGFEIYTMNVDGSDRKPVTSRDLDWMPSWSPDSRMIAFSSGRSGTFNIWVVNADGTGLRQVTSFGEERIAITPVFSPDGQRIAFSTIAEGTAWEIWVVNLDGSNPHKVVGTVGTDRANSTNIAAWRNGTFLIGGYQGHWDPYFVSESGGEPTRITISDKDDKPSDWRP